MTRRLTLIAAVVVLTGVVLTGCGSTPSAEKTSEKKTEAPAPPPVKDDTDKLPSANRTSVQIVQNHLLGKEGLPGGTIGDYDAKGSQYREFVIETEAPQDAAILLLDVKGTLKDPSYVASFGGYFGSDSNGDLFVFAKGKYLAGVVGLTQARADAAARELAAKLN